MNGFVDDLKFAWSKPNNGLVRLIIINVIAYLILSIAFVISQFSGTVEFYKEFIYGNLAIPPHINDFIFKPWTLVTYFFNHSITDFFHILFNMLVLYWFGIIFQEFLGSRKLVALYILGGLAGGVAYLLVYNLIPYFSQGALPSGMVGASASVYAIVVGAATLMPDYRMNLLLLGPVRIKYIAAFYIFISFLGTTGGNAGGNIAHLGGALMGFLFIKQMQKGDDWSKPINKMLDGIVNLFQPKPKIKVTYRKDKAAKGKKARAHAAVGGADEPDQEVVDAILDKISESGYEKLTSEEKNILFKASQKKS